MNETSALNNSLTPGCQTLGAVGTPAPVGLFPGRLRISQELPTRQVPFPFQTAITQEQRWDKTYFPKEHHAALLGEMFGQPAGSQILSQDGPPYRDAVAFLRPSAAQPERVVVHETNQMAEQRWLLANRSLYIGQWVALSGDSMFAAGPNASEVYAKARAQGAAVPFVAYLDPDDHLPFAGW